MTYNSKTLLSLMLVQVLVLAFAAQAYVVSAATIEQYAIGAVASSEYGDSNCVGYWCTNDAAGPPNTYAECVPRNDEFAWAPLTGSSDPEWLYATFNQPVYATQVNVHELFEAGLVSRVTLFDVSGVETVVFDATATPDTTPCPGVLSVNFSMTATLVKSVLIDTAVDGYEEIDAVQLIGEFDGSPVAQWASVVVGSSSYGEWEFGAPGDGWAATKIVGPPRPMGCADEPSAWAPLGYSSEPEWIEAYYAVPVHATSLTIYETYEAPFVTQVDLIDTDDNSYTIWSGTDVTTCPGEFVLDFAETSYHVAGVRVHTQVDGYEEIDAVLLVGKTHLENDADGDGIADSSDLCPDTAPLAAVDANGCSDAQVDSDADGVCNPGTASDGPSACTGSDNCPTVSNPLQTQTGNNVGGQFGDACVNPNVNVSPGVTIGANPTIGDGTQINKGVTIGDDAVIGDNVIFAKDVIAGDNLVIGEGSTLNKNVSLGDDVVLGMNVTLSRGCMIGNGVVIGNNTFIGQDCIIGDDVTIGDNVSIGKNVTVLFGTMIPDYTTIPKEVTVPPLP